MPTVLRDGRLRIMIYGNDHRPAQVHVWGLDGEAVFILNCRQGPAELRENYGLPRRVLGKAELFINKNISKLCDDWEQIHGDT